MITVETLRMEHILDPATGFHLQRHRQFTRHTRLHRHDFMEIFLITAGEIEHWLGHRSIRLKATTAVLIRPEDAHAVHIPKHRSASYINMAFGPDTYHEMGRFLGMTDRLNGLLRSNGPPTVEVDRSEACAMAAKMEACAEAALMDRVRARAQFRSLLARVLADWFGGILPEYPFAPPDWLTHLCQYMEQEEHWREGRPLLMRKACRTPEHVARSFRQWTGQTPTAFVNNLRLRHAAILLASTDETVDWVAYESGFANLSHFHHLFKKQFDMTPRSYRMRSRATAFPPARHGLMEY